MASKQDKVLDIITTLGGLLQLRTKKEECGTTKPLSVSQKWTEALCDQSINSAIVAAISGISTFMATSNTETGFTSAGVAALITFGWTFLNKMKEYRGIKE
jgi:hypothetical protein